MIYEYEHLKAITSKKEFINPEHKIDKNIFGEKLDEFIKDFVIKYEKYNILIKHEPYMESVLENFFEKSLEHFILKYINCREQDEKTLIFTRKDYDSILNQYEIDLALPYILESIKDETK